MPDDHTADVKEELLKNAVSLELPVQDEDVLPVPACIPA